MKRVTALSELLDGNNGKKRKLRKRQNQRDKENDDSSSISVDTNTSGSGEEMVARMVLRRPKILPVSSSSDQKSVHNVLMSKKSTLEPEVIDIEQEDVLESASLESYKNAKHLSLPTNHKRTRLKDMFSNFSKPITHKDPRAPETNYTPTVRYHQISKQEQVPCEWPTHQSVQPEIQISAHNDILLLTGYQKVKDYSSLDTSNLIDFQSLSSSTFEHGDTPGSTPQSEVTTQVDKTTKIWPEFFKPANINEVLLDPKLKKAVNSWIETAFEKLRRPTTRNQLLRLNKAQEQNDMDSFIVFDDEEVNAYDKERLEEFVPLMLLYGDAVGKNTLIETIMHTLGGQIYEVNSSSDRNKKDILEKLSEFSTSHYVKAKGSKGIILFDDIDVLFKEHDKFFWQAVEKLLLNTRRPIVLLSRDMNFVPANLIEIMTQNSSLFKAKKVSHKTIIRFLHKYFDDKGWRSDPLIIENIVKQSKNDIRKCLIELQFYYSHPGKVLLNDIDNMSTPETYTNLEAANFHLNILSCADILHTNTHIRSLLLQDEDKSLMTMDSKAIISNSDDDQFKLQYDYMIDYRLHLRDPLFKEQLPFEMNIGNTLSTPIYHPPLHNNIKLTKITTAAMAYLSTRVKPRSTASNNAVRRTRNSRLIREIINDFEGTSILDDIDMSAGMDLVLTTKSNLAQLVNPYILEIAKAESRVKMLNRQLFKEHVEGIEKEKYHEIVQQLRHDSLLKPIWFKGDPQRVINSWE